MSDVHYTSYGATVYDNLGDPLFRAELSYSDEIRFGFEDGARRYLSPDDARNVAAALMFVAGRVETDD